MSIQRIICCLGSVVLLLAIVGCHESTEVTSNASGLPKLGDLWDLAQISTAPDSDGDFIPDDVEIAWLHTDPKDRDTDHDGLPDNYEVFGLGLFDRDAWVPDLDQDGKIAALDNDDDDDQVNDGLYIDTDEDGIANYLEFYGYIYDWMTGMFLSCEDINCTGATVYKSDPLQPSTDQDAYSDAMEVSGLRMDVSVDYPGQNPLVPAYPNLVVELVGYSVTLNEDIEYGKGGSLSKGTEWSTGTERSHTFTSEGSWTAGIEVGDENKFSTSFTLGFSNSNTTTHSVSKTTSVTSEVNWSESRSSNPTDAAHVKLLLKVHNYGTACASNIIPTLTLRVAGLNVTTFEPGNAQINMLVPGATYPEEDGVFWVVDSTDSGGPISLTMTELRAFESGAPISVVMTQVKADVLLLNNGGAWEQVGDCNEYLARCDAACANLRLDMGEGSFLHTMVYSGNSPSSPVVTLRDALRWTADLTVEADGYHISYMDPEGVPTSTVLRDWTFAFDHDTLLANGYDPDDLAGTVPPNADLGDLVLLPDSIVIGKAPRSLGQPTPNIHFAYLDEDKRMAQVCASDYRGVEEVVVYVSVDRNDGQGPQIEEWPMVEHTVDSNLYVHEFNDDEWAIVEGILQRQIDPAPGIDDTLVAKATSIGGEVGQGAFRLIPPNPRPVPWVIDAVVADLPNHLLYARVVPDERYPAHWSESYQVQWVKAFHPLIPGGVRELKAPPNQYEDAYGYQCALPDGNYETPIKIVALVVPGVYSEREVPVRDFLTAFTQGTIELTHPDFEWIDLIFKSWDVEFVNVDFHPAEAKAYSFVDNYRADWPPASGSAWDPTWDVYKGWKVGAADFYVRWDDTPGADDFRLFFNFPFKKMAQGTKLEDVTASIARNSIPATVGASQVFNESDVFVFETTWGYVGKMQITRKNKWRHKAPLIPIPLPWWECGVTFDFVVFQEPSAFIRIGQPQPIVFSKYYDSIELDASYSTADTSWNWYGTTPTGADATIDKDDEEYAYLIPDDGVAGDYVIRLVINEGLPTEAEAEKTITILFPEAKITDPPSDPHSVTFQPSDVPLVTLKGGTSVGARNHAWAITQRPSGSAAVIDSTTKNSANSSFVPDKNGDYTVTLTINLGDSDQDVASVKITVSGLP